MKQFCFPKIESISLKDFSLYSKMNDVELKICQGINCLAGANGLGKSTFISVLNFGLTGIVKDPESKLLSPDEIIKTAYKNYTIRYFSGRIKPKSKKQSEVEIIFKLRNKRYRIIRNFFEWQQIRLLEIFEIRNGKAIPIIECSDKSPQELNEIYSNNLSSDIGMDYKRFFFLQLFVFTFDEHRGLLVWDERHCQTVMSIVFYENPADAEKLIQLRRRIEKYESNARNKQWQARQISNKISELTDDINNNDFDEHDYEQYLILCGEIDHLSLELDKIKSEKDVINKQLQELALDSSMLRRKHKGVFNSYSEPNNYLLNNQMVKGAVQQNSCFLCGASGKSVKSKLLTIASQERCPVCDTNIEDGETINHNELFRELELLDKEILIKEKETSDLIDTLNEKNDLIKLTSEDLNSLKSEKKKILGNNNIPNEEPSKFTDLINRYKEEIDTLMTEKEAEYAKRNDIKDDYNNLQTSLNSSYKKAEINFLPYFKKLAEEFLGMDTLIQMKKESKGLIMNITINKISRTGQFHLSESQRFFLDIAFRMALIEYMAGIEKPIFVVDTPEGSLDIAYENRAGKMFSSFIKNENCMLMTANINASQLLLTLADECRSENMVVTRMIDWTELSVVQKEGEALFQTVFDKIEKNLLGVHI